MAELSTDPSAEPDWRWIGQIVESRRIGLNLIQDQVVSRTANTISRSWLQQIERGHTSQRRSPIKLAQLAEALEWPTDAFDYLRRGELPPERPVKDSSADIQAIEAKLDQILDLLRRRETVHDPQASQGSG